MVELGGVSLAPDAGCRNRSAPGRTGRAGRFLVATRLFRGTKPCDNRTTSVQRVRVACSAQRACGERAVTMDGWVGSGWARAGQPRARQRQRVRWLRRCIGWLAPRAAAEARHGGRLFVRSSHHRAPSHRATGH